MLSAIAEVQPGTPLHGELLRELRVALRESRDPNSWASCAEEELRNLDPGALVFDDRRRELHRELARTYEQNLGQPDDALQHLRALADSGDDGAAPEESTDATNSPLLRLLRVQGNWIELERRLSTHLERRPDDPQGWLELGQLRDEGSTIVMVTHDPSLGSEAGRRLFIRDGRVHSEPEPTEHQA